MINPVRIGLLLCTSLIISVIAGIAQDTIKVEKSKHYSSKQFPDRGKDFASQVEFAREDIVYSDKHRRIEHCYYYDNKRICHGTDYILVNDSTLQEDEITWKYTPIGSLYFMEHYYEGTYVSGHSSSLIPLSFVGNVVITTSDKIDTLWSVNCDLPIRQRSIQLHKTKFREKVFTASKIDTPPLLIHGDSLKTIHLRRTDGCPSEPLYFVDEIQFVVTKEGRIVNIEQSVGNINIEYCPGYIMDLMRYLIRLGPLKPATKDGENVHVLWKLKVDMHEE